MSILIKNGLVVDGTGFTPYEGALYIEGEQIKTLICEEDPGYMDDLYELECQADQIIDVKGQVIAPGFIDTHSHSDLKVLVEPELFPKLFQGITTEVLGQDGISMAPLPLEYIEPWKKNLAGLNGTSEEIDWTYKTCEGYFDAIIAAKPSMNCAYLLPHGNIRMEAIGLDNTAATPEDVEKMKAITRREMEAGCIGVSSGLIYMPCAYSQTDELVEICKVVAEYDGVFVVHQRSEADTIIESMEEIIEIGERSGVAIHFSHFKVCGKKNWHHLDAMLDLLDEGRERGVKITLDQYPYPAGSTMLGVILPPWAHDGGTDMLVKRLGNEEDRARMTKSIEEGIEGWDNFVDFAGVERIYITSVATKANEDVVQLSLKELGEKRQKPALEATYDLLLEEKNAVGMVNFYGTEEHITKIMNRAETNICTDALLSAKPHPRAYGAFPRVLGKYVREEQMLSMETAIKKMTLQSARAMGIRKRGALRPGYFADITIFDHKAIIDKGTFVDPAQYPTGISYVIVNGTILIENGGYTGEKAGKFIKGGNKYNKNID